MQCALYLLKQIVLHGYNAFSGWIILIVLLLGRIRVTELTASGSSNLELGKITTPLAFTAAAICDSPVSQPIYIYYN